jgi:hypothetical protein
MSIKDPNRVTTMIYFLVKCRESSRVIDSISVSVESRVIPGGMYCQNLYLRCRIECDIGWFSVGQAFLDSIVLNHWTGGIHFIRV